MGVSGGADSVALLHLLVAAGFRNLVVCHLDHRLRGRESTADATFVKRLTENLGLPCEMGRADVASLAEKTGTSVETAAREARHAFFRDCAKRHRCPRIVLAHHADDQAETVLWNLLRGARGAKGMREAQLLGPLEIHRPLLGVRREDLRGWLAARKLRWREDASNAEPVFTRNRLRHEALPLLAEIAGRDVIPQLCRAAEATDELEAIASWAVAHADVLDPQGRLHLPALRNLPPSLQTAVIHDYLRRQEIPDIDRRLIENALRLLDPAAPPAVNLPGGRSLRRRAGRLLVE